jgi:hypothetical protein
MSLFYTTGYRHQTSREISVQTPIKPDREIETFFLCLDVTGLLTLKRGFAWDGASGPTFPSADELFYRQLRENGMNRFRARMWYKAVRKLAGGAAKKPRKVFSVPLPGGM